MTPRRLSSLGNNTHKLGCARTLTPTPGRPPPTATHSHRLDPELLPQDFDPEYGVGPADGATLEKDLFGDLIGCGDIKLQLKRTRAAFILAERLGRDPREVRIRQNMKLSSFFSRYVSRSTVCRFHIRSARDNGGEIEGLYGKNVCPSSSVSKCLFLQRAVSDTQENNLFICRHKPCGSTSR